MRQDVSKKSGFLNMWGVMCSKTGVLLTCAALAGCATPGAPHIVQVPVPVPCPAAVPDRPAMPTETLPDGAGLDVFVAAAIAEIERREGYEGQLRAVLENCIAPID